MSGSLKKRFRSLSASLLWLTNFQLSLPTQWIKAIFATKSVTQSGNWDNWNIFITLIETFFLTFCPKYQIKPWKNDSRILDHTTFYHKQVTLKNWKCTLETLLFVTTRLSDLVYSSDVICGTTDSRILNFAKGKYFQRRLIVVIKTMIRFILHLWKWEQRQIGTFKSGSWGRRREVVLRQSVQCTVGNKAAILIFVDENIFFSKF